MPYTDRARQSKYQAEWMQKRRQEWLDAHGPCIDCGSTENPEVDHQDYSKKVEHRVWSWSKGRRDAELAKCVVRCRPCHYAKTSREHAERFCGEKQARAALTTEIVRWAREQYATGQYTWPQLAKQLGVHPGTLRKSCNYRWRSV